MIRFRSFGAAVAWGVLSNLTQAQPLIPKSITDALTPVFSDKNKLAGSQVNWDNDAWVFGHTDRWYTNGTRYSWTYRANDPDSTLGRMGAAIGKYAMRIDQTPTLTYTVGQTMYTPRDITVATFQPDDRPWAAFLYLGVTGSHNDGEGSFSTADLKLGWTGQPALGEFTQETVHRVIGSPRPAGWAHQIEPRLGVQLSYAKVHLLAQDILKDRVGLQVGWGGALGSLRNYANANATVVVGNLATYGGKRTPPLLIANEGDFVVQDFGNVGVYQKPFVYLSVGVNAVASNYFISGHTLSGTANVKHLPLVGMAQMGASLPLNTWFNRGRAYWPRVVYAINLRSPEFETIGAPKLGSVQRWGSLTLNWDFE